MALQDIEKDLQRRESTVSKRPRKSTPYDVWSPHVEPVREPQERGTWQKITDHLGPARLKALVFGTLALSLIILMVLALQAIVRYRQGFFNSDRVVITVNAPDAIASTTTTEVTFTIHNNNRAALTHADIAVAFGSSFVPEEHQENFQRHGADAGTFDVGTIAGGATVTKTVVGHFNGPEGSIADVAGTVRYVPEGMSVQYSAIGRSATMITQSPLTIDINAPNDVAGGNLVDIGIVVRNTGTEDARGLSLSVTVPQSFGLVTTVPTPNHGLVWLLDTVPARGEVVVRLRGTVNGDVGTTQAFHAVVAAAANPSVVFARKDYAPRMIFSPLILSQSVEGRGVVYAGESLRYSIRFHNIGDTPLRDAIVRVRLDGRILHLAGLDIGGIGDYNPDDKTITWKASDVPALKLLEPNARGEVTFSVPIVEQLPVESEKDFHYAVSTVASIDSPDIPSAIRENKTVLSNVLAIPIGAKVVPTTTVLYKEGALPPQVGKTTTYDITFAVTSVNNDLSQVRMVIPLPTSVTFHKADGKGVAFNERTNEVVWNMGTITHGAGVTSPAPTMTLTLRVVPSVEQVGRPLRLAHGFTLTGMDTFIDKKFELQQSAIETTAAQNHKDQHSVAATLEIKL